LERYQHGESSGVNENAEILKAHLDEVRGIAQVADI
jgi:hypothetical protein